MKKFAAINTTALEIEGEVISPGSKIAILESYFDADRIQALFDSRILCFVSVDELAKIEAAQEPDDSDLDEEPGDGIASDETTTSETADEDVEPAKTVDQLASEAFPGLKPRIAIALYTQKIESVSKLRHYIVDHQDLLDLDGIGKAASAEVLAWLSSDAEE